MPNLPKTIHHVNLEGSLSFIKSKYELIFSSHAIEHSVDIIEHLLEVYSLLEEHGVYCLVIPNKRYCFDHFVPESTAEEMILAHESSYFKNANIIRSLMYRSTRRAHNDPVRHWSGNHASPKSDFANALKSAKSFEANEIFHIGGVHKWYFSHQSIVDAFNKLFKLSYVDFKIIRHFPPKKEKLDICLILQKD